MRESGKLEEDHLSVEVKYDPSFDMDLKMFSHEAIFKQKIKVLSEKRILP